MDEIDVREKNDEDRHLSSFGEKFSTMFIDDGEIDDAEFSPQELGQFCCPKLTRFRKKFSARFIDDVENPDEALQVTTSRNQLSTSVCSNSLGNTQHATIIIDDGENPHEGVPLCVSDNCKDQKIISQEQPFGKKVIEDEDDNEAKSLEDENAGIKDRLLGWAKNILMAVKNILMAIIFGILLSTYDTWTDGDLFYLFYSNGQMNWGFLILCPIFANTFFTLCSMLYTKGFKGVKKAILAVIFAIFVILQLYPQLCTFSNLARLFTSREVGMVQFTKLQDHASGTLGTLESFIEATPSLFIQTAFLAHTGLSLSTLKHQTCFKQNCNDLAAQMEECKNINQTHDEFNNVTNINIDNSIKFETCKQSKSQICEEQVDMCISQLEVQLSNLTLSDLQLDQNEKWKNTSLHKNFDMTRGDLDTIALYLILFGDEKWKFWISYIISYLSAAYGITSYLKNGSGRFISSMGLTFAKVFGAVLLSLLWKVFYLYSLVRLSGLSEFLNIFCWILTCFLPQLVYITARVYLKCPQAFTSSKNFLIFKQPQLFLITCISPVAFDVYIEKSSTKSFAVFKVSKKSTFYANIFQAIISFPFIFKLTCIPFFSWFFPAWTSLMGSDVAWVYFLFIVMIILSILVVVIIILIYLSVFACANMSLFYIPNVFDQNSELRKCVLHEETNCEKCYSKSGVVFEILSAEEENAQKKNEESILKPFKKCSKFCSGGLCLCMTIIFIIGVLLFAGKVIYSTFIDSGDAIEEFGDDIGDKIGEFGDDIGEFGDKIGDAIGRFDDAIRKFGG